MVEYEAQLISSHALRPHFGSPYLNEAGERPAGLKGEPQPRAASIRARYPRLQAWRAFQRTSFAETAVTRQFVTPCENEFA